MQIGLKKIEVSQSIELHELAVQTFDETFASQNTPKNMQWYFETTMTLENTKKELSNPDSYFYFAFHHEQIIGYLKLNFNAAQTETVLGNTAFEIERIYIKREFQGKGLGSELFNTALHLGREKGYNQMWLGVWEHNDKAIHFYKKKGLKAFDQHIFQLGDDAQTDILMRLDF